MKKVIVLLCLLASVFIQKALAQDNTLAEYTEWVKKGSDFYKAKQYQQSAIAYSKAFLSTGGLAWPNDRYDAACSWAQAGNNDSAFTELNSIVTQANYNNLFHLIIDSDLKNLHTDKRWEPLCAIVKQNKDKSEEGLMKPQVAILDTVYMNDQNGRMTASDYEQKYGQNSSEVKMLWQTIKINDSLDLIKVENILDEYGWLGIDKIGDNGNTTLFLVIQHSALKVQEKYLPIMREAVKKGSAEASALALLEDRVALREGRKQIYGSQIGGDNNGHYWVSPLEDPDNVDKRRAEVHLRPLADYVKQWGMTWDVAQYKKDLPEIEKKDNWKE